jgi:hypothetical protein
MTISTQLTVEGRRYDDLFHITAIWSVDAQPSETLLSFYVMAACLGQIWRLCQGECSACTVLIDKSPSILAQPGCAGYRTSG